jgi:mannose-1-phosphate guanylyltransferase
LNDEKERMMQNSHIWAVVLAAGDGKRLASLTADNHGRHIPKQYCSVQHGLSLLELALVRARTLAAEERVCAVVAKAHEHWWRPMADDMHPGNLIVQPRNRGTGNGVLLALAHILKRDPLARFIILPADHHVLDEAILTRAMQSALAVMTPQSNEIVLFGVEPDDADPDLGYVIPQETTLHDGPMHDVHGVRRFVEKPSRGVAAKLIQEGGLWNSGIIAANGAPLLELFRQRFPDATADMMHAVARTDDPMNPAWSLSHLYERMSDVDFSHHILQLCVSDLEVVRVPHCGWSDLGTPTRVSERVNLLSVAAPRQKGRRVASPLSLADAIVSADRRSMSAGIH